MRGLGLVDRRERVGRGHLHSYAENRHNVGYNKKNKAQKPNVVTAIRAKKYSMKTKLTPSSRGGSVVVRTN